MRETLLALDFDGVIWDSVGECYRTAQRAWAALEGAPAPVPEEAFRRGRWMVQAGGEFGLVLRLLLEDPDRDLEGLSLEEFEARSARETGWMARFQAAFYAERTRAMRDEREAWLASQAPYQAMLAELPALRGAFRDLVICTTKDEASTRELLATAGLEFPILSREFSVDKGDQVRHLAATRDLPVERIILLDDLVPNLEPVARAGARGALAGWGYNTRAVRAEARRLGFPVIRAGHVLEDLRAHLGA